MANCVKMCQKTRKNQWCADVPNFFLPWAASCNTQPWKIRWIWQFFGSEEFREYPREYPPSLFCSKNTHVFFLNTHVWWKKFSVSFLPSKNHDAFLLTLAVCCLPFSDTHLLAATGSYLAATWPQGGSVLKAPLIQWGSETRWRQIVRLGSTKSIA